MLANDKISIFVIPSKVIRDNRTWGSVKIVESSISAV